MSAELDPTNNYPTVLTREIDSKKDIKFKGILVETLFAICSNDIKLKGILDVILHFML